MISEDRLVQITQRFEYLEAQMSEGRGDIAALSKEYSDLRPVVATIRDWQTARSDMDEAQAMLADAEMRDLAEEEIERLTETLPELEEAVQLALLPFMAHRWLSLLRCVVLHCIPVR